MHEELIMGTKMVWKKVNSSFWENKQKGESLALTKTGPKGILGKGYQFLHGWVAELYARNPMNSMRSVFDTKKEALAEIKRYMREHP